MKIDAYINFLTLMATLVGFIIGFLNPAYRILAWSISFIVAAIVILFLIVKEYISQIEENTKDIEEIRKDLNISNRLSRLEGKFEIMQKRAK